MTSPELSVILVHYHAAELAARAVERLEADLSASGRRAEILVVDNGSDAAGRRILAALPVRLLEPGGNLGYAAGANLGAREARGRWLVVMNPDVLVLPGCCARLIDELEAGAAAAGPRFFWDEDRRFLLPPPERRTRRDTLLRVLALRSKVLARLARRRWRTHARRHWLAAGPIPTRDLSGALLAVRRDAWDRVGPFDPEYRLYFEETDWLHRAAELGLDTRLVPGAEAVHLYDRSASREPRSSEWFAASRRRFERRHYGSVFAALLEKVERLGRGAGGSPGAVDEVRDEDAELSDPPELALAPPRGAASPLWVELSPSALGFPAAAERVDAAVGDLSWRLPRYVWRCLRPGGYWIRVTDARGDESSPAALVKAAGGRTNG